MKKVFAMVFFCTGLFLIGLNLFGLFISIRNEDIYNEDETYFKDDITLTENQFWQELKKRDKSDEAFSIRVNTAINQGIAHYWKDEGIDKYNIRIPIYENYILYIASYLIPSKFRKFEYSNNKKAIERGIGLCSQHAILLSDILERNGINTKIINLPVHVVVLVQVNKDNNIWWIIDPDFGLIIRNDIKDVINDPEIIINNYENKRFNLLDIDALAEAYGKVKNDDIYEDSYEYIGWKRYYTEKLAYVLKWIFPLFLIVMSICLGRRYKINLYKSILNF